MIQQRFEGSSRRRIPKLASHIWPILAVAALAATGCSPCPGFEDPVVAGTVDLDEIVEASGLGASRIHPGVLWTHNDSGAARLYALASDARWLGSFDLVGAGIRDWEDLAVGPGPDPSLSYIHIADIGDNDEQRPGITIYRLPEPALPTTPVLADLAGVEAIQLVYPDGPHNAETFLVDPRSGDFYIVTKSVGSESTALVFRAAAPVDSASVTTLTPAGSLDFDRADLPGNARVTGGDIAPAGDEIVLRTYTNLFAWCREEGQSIEDAFAGEPCGLPVAIEPQGEAVAFAADGQAYYTLSEFADRPLHRSDRTN